MICCWLRALCSIEVLQGEKMVTRQCEYIPGLFKDLLLPSALTEETWKRVCRKADYLHEMKSECVRSSGVDAKSGSKAPKRHDHEETMMRRELRQANLFQSPIEMHQGHKVRVDRMKLSIQIQP